MTMTPSIVSEADAKRAAILRTYHADLVSGAVFARAALSHRSAYGYRPPLGNRAWAHALATIAEMAGKGDNYGMVAAAILRPLASCRYQTGPEMAAHIYEAASAAIAEGYTDVLGATGPEAGRRSSYERPFTAAECAVIAVWLTEAIRLVAESTTSIGWCLAHVIGAERVHTHLLPKSLAATLAPKEA